MKRPKLTAADLDRAQRWRESPLITSNGGTHVDTDRLLAGGAIEGPFRRTRPVTATWRMRVSRALRSLVLTLRSPL